LREGCWFVAAVTGPCAGTPSGARIGLSRLVITIIVVTSISIVVGVGGGVTSVTCVALVIRIVIVVVIRLVSPSCFDYYYYDPCHHSCYYHSFYRPSNTFNPSNPSNIFSPYST
jgi:hypothetical protein